MSHRDPSSLLSSLPEGAPVLIVRLRSLGDVVLLTPALSALHAWRPDLRLCVLVEPFCAPLLEGNPAVAELLLMKGFLAAARDLRHRHFPVVYNQHAGPSSALLVAAIGAPQRVCWTRRQFSFVYNVLVPDPGGRIHTVEHRIEQFYATGLPRRPIPPARVYPQPDAVAAVADVLSARGIAAGTPYAVLHPGAKYFTKRWAIDKFLALARWLREKHGIEPVFNLGLGEAEIAAEVRHQCGNEFVLLDSLGLRQLIALIAGCRMFIGNDSGPAHIASALARPVVAIFGSSSSVHWRPWQTKHRVVQNDFPCNPCRGDRCYAFAEPRCILSVTFDQVCDAADGLLGETSVSADGVGSSALQSRASQ
ncbi:MAG TPA: glycosyltransferase family 9 protein [Candidatus Limnocylindrales bacterium]|nr:glycosyltransferase family 9 protein [Candidatus Limnocylindrales bacterium]